MKISEDGFRKNLHESIINKKIDVLRKSGYEVFREYRFPNAQVIVDLYAIKDKERIIYEVKIGSKRIRENQYKLLQKIASENNAKLKVVYAEIPKSSVIEIDFMNEYIFAELVKNNHLSNSEEVDELISRFKSIKLSLDKVNFKAEIIIRDLEEQNIKNEFILNATFNLIEKVFTNFNLKPSIIFEE
jgi:Holliday junction resolvase